MCFLGILPVTESVEEVDEDSFGYSYGLLEASENKSYL